MFPLYVSVDAVNGNLYFGNLSSPTNVISWVVI